jgi:hypothetical protein
MMRCDFVHQSYKTLTMVNTGRRIVRGGGGGGGGRGMGRGRRSGVRRGRSGI